MNINFVGIVNAIPGAMSQGVLWGIMVLGVYITYKVLDYADLTVDGSFALGGATSAILIVKGCNPFLSLLLATLAGALAGAVTGFLHTKLKIPGILSGILVMIALYSVNLRVMDNSSNTPLLGMETIFTTIEKLPIFQALGSSIKLGVFTFSTKSLIGIIVGVVFSAVIIALMYWFFGTETGCAIRATGNNPYMVRALGANTDWMKMVGLFLSNALVALSGALVAQNQGYGDSGMGTGTIVIGLASVIIGEVVFVRRMHSFGYYLAAVVAGSVIYRIIIALVLQLGLSSTDLKLLTAIIVAIALSIPVIGPPLKKTFNIGKSTKATVSANQGGDGNA